MKVRLTKESIPFRESVIRIALWPFPRQRKDGTYKVAQSCTPYLVFPDKSACKFNDLFDRSVVLQWPNGSPITLREREEIDDAAWGIMLKYGLFVGAFFRHVFDDSYVA
jgi:hypothetical protein